MREEQDSVHCSDSRAGALGNDAKGTAIQAPRDDNFTE
jgi:hypothetical protein